MQPKLPRQDLKCFTVKASVEAEFHQADGRQHCTALVHSLPFSLQPGLSTSLHRSPIMVVSKNRGLDGLIDAKGFCSMPDMRPIPMRRCDYLDLTL